MDTIPSPISIHLSDPSSPHTVCIFVDHPYTIFNHNFRVLSDLKTSSIGSKMKA
ncbi:hypothetical protein DPMN_071684 [Dreissena polymorpha]|uniref:Uncharacterized protein n=1 Tax=Dreissena polymorpha TaxID=45954 RepID=A0A9D4BWG2_DREPO|nr:hypothetical protein DPMN_071684 [Dreissena polymorpha]